MKLETLQEGMQRIIDAAQDRFNALCEESGHDPDSPELTGEDEEEEGEGEEGENAEGDNAETVDAAGGDENVMPTPVDAEGGEAQQSGMEMAAAQSGIEGGAQPPAEIPAEAQQIDTTAAPQETQLTPEQEDELKKQQSAASQQ